MSKFPKRVVICSISLALLLLLNPLVNVNAQQNPDSGTTAEEDAAEFSVTEFDTGGEVDGQVVDESEAESLVIEGEFQVIVDSPDILEQDADSPYIDPQAEHDTPDPQNVLVNQLFLPLINRASSNANDVSAAALDESASAGASAAGSGVMGDFNGDFFNDLVIGVPYEDIGDIENAGVVQVIYGWTGGLNTTTKPDQIWHQDSPNIDGMAEPLDLFGEALAVGDFNGDGFDDLAIGTRFEDFELTGGQFIADAGTVNVIYGSSQGLHPSAAHLDEIWHQNSSGIQGAMEANDRFGQSLTAGDFNNDGYADLAIGVPEENAVSNSVTLLNVGFVNVIYGSDVGLHASRRVQNQLWSQNGPVADVLEAFDYFGAALNTGDFNRDGFADLVVGVPHEDIGTIIDAGGVNVIYGSAAGLNATTIPNPFWYQNNSTIAITPQANNRFGWALAVGDFDGNGHDDLAIGAPNDDVNGVADAGEVIVLSGFQSGLVSLNSIWHQNSANINDVAEVNDHFGSALAAGQFNRSRSPTERWFDLAIGVPDEDIGTVVDGGAVNVIYGSALGLDAVNVPDQFWTQNGGIASDGVGTGDHFGFSLSAGRLGGKIDDGLHVGVPGEDISTVANAGAVHTIYGSENGLATAGSQFWRQGAAGLDGATETGDEFGSAVQ